MDKPKSQWIPPWRHRLNHPGLQVKPVPPEQPTKLFNKNFVILSQGQFVSRLGNQAFFIAMMFWLKHATNSASMVGTLMMLSTLPMIILGPFAGTIADRVSRRKIIIITDMATGIAGLSLVYVLLRYPDSTTLCLVWLFVVSIFGGIMGSFFGPAISASIPDLVPRQKVAAANSISQTSGQVAMFIGQACGGVLLRALGAPLMFLIDALSFIFSSISEMFITIPQKFDTAAEKHSEVLQQFLKEAKVGFGFIMKTKGLRDLCFMAAFFQFFFAPFIVLLPFYVEDHLKVGAEWFGYILAVEGIGMLIGSMAAGVIKLPVR